MGTPTHIKRTQVPLTPDGDESIRVYFALDADTPPMPSVTTIKDVRVDPEKENALTGWRERYDGQSQYARPWYEDQKVFKGYRGTLVHFIILSELANQQAGDADAAGDTHFHAVGDDDWGYEEYYAEYCLKKWSKQAPSANSDEVPYTPRANQYDGEHAWDKAIRDTKWATRQFQSELINSGRIEPQNVIGVEEYVFDTEYGYGGQYDLLYETPDGRTVLSDLKTSSAVRFDHKLQSAAYKRAVESQRDMTIDETEVIRLHPDSETVEISRSPDWDRTLDGLQHQFLSLCDQAWAVDYADALERAREEIESEYAQSRQTELTETTAD